MPLARPLISLLLLLLTLAALPVQAADATAATPAPTLEALKPGQFYWHPEFSPAGPLTLVVSLDEQRLFVYRNGVAIGVSTVSTGKPGKDTPTGVFTILQKKVEHYSNLYNSAPMPYMQRLTWDGIALHAGNLPGYPASHGCIRLPREFAKQLFGVTNYSSTTVIIADRNSAPAEVASPGLFAPEVKDGQAQAPAAGAEAFWQDGGPDAGPLSLLISRADSRLYAYRGGKLIGELPATLGKAGSGGTAVFTLLENPPAGMTPADAKTGLRWSAVHLDQPGRGDTPLAQLGDLHVAPEYAQALLSAVSAGTTLILTDWPSSREGSGRGQDLTVISDDDDDGDGTARRP